MDLLVAGLNVLALTLAGLTSTAMIWSVIYPDRRVWPPRFYGPQTPVIVWGVTCALFGAIIALGILGWGEAPTADPLRYVLGPLLILLGNLGVWSEVIRFGLSQTGGAVGLLKVDKIYRYSRNPQYIADIAILIGWALLSASVIALPAIVAVILVLLIAPFAEEPWLLQQYGQAYRHYKAMVRRYL